MRTETVHLRECREDVSLTGYILDDSPEMLRGAKRPAVLVCPGGAYLFCSDREGEPVALAFAAMGYHAFVLRYSRYFGGEQGFGDAARVDALKPERAHPAPMRDIALAMKHIHAHAEAWLVDVDRIAICGFSAGAHNCAMYAVHWDKPLVTEFVGGSYPAAAAILCYGLSDYLGDAARKLDAAEPDLSRAVNIALLGVAEPSEQMRLAVSPARLTSDSTPPAFIWATAADELVPVGHSLAMAAGLERAGVPFEMHIFEAGQHGLSTAAQNAAGSRAQLNPDVAQWVGLAERWLQKRFALPIS